jgi:hypothetical protein
VKHDSRNLGFIFSKAAGWPLLTIAPLAFFAALQTTLVQLHDCGVWLARKPVDRAELFRAHFLE